MALPTLVLRPDVADAILRNLASGCFVDEAAQAEGIDKGTVKEWMARGRRVAAMARDEQELDPLDILYLDFYLRATKARGRAKVEAHARISAAMRGTVTVRQPDGSERQVTYDGRWQAGAWYLQVQDPQRYGRWTRTGTEFPTPEQVEDLATAEPELDEDGVVKWFADFKAQKAADGGEQKEASGG